MRRLEMRQIVDTLTVCPYCMNPPRNEMGCCGESSAHFETAYVTDQDETLLDSEVTIVSEGEISD